MNVRVVLPVTSPHTAKDQKKSGRATKFIGRGSPGSSTAAYARAWGDNPYGHARRELLGWLIAELEQETQL